MPVARPESSESRVIAHIDMDCFYVQVEQRRRPELKGLPTAVVQYNTWKGGGLIAVGYEARKDGVKRSMRGDEAKQVCPQIHLVQVPVAHGKADLSIYRNAGSEVVSILSKLGRCERASIDEVYLDLTEAAERMLIENPPESMEAAEQEVFKSHILGLNEDDCFVKEDVTEWICRTDADHRDKLLACGAVIVAELRMQVLKETEFTCSAGIAHNKMLAKLASGMNKPAQQTVVPFSSVKALLSSLPIKKMKQLGGKLGSSLQSDLGLNTVGDLLQFSEEKLQERYGINTGTWLWNIARGISGEEVEVRLLPKSHGSGKTFSGSQALKTFDSVQHWLNELCEELSERLQSDMEQNKRIAQTLTLHASAYKSINIDQHKNFPSKSCPLRYGTAKIQQDALNLFQAGLREFLEPYRAKSKDSQHDGWKITGLSVSASKIVDIPSGTCSIMKYFHAQDLSVYPSKQPLEKATKVTATMSPLGTECQSEPYPTEPHLDFSVEESTINHSLSRLNHQQQEREIQAQITTGEQTSSFSLSGLSSPNDNCLEMNRVETRKDTHNEEIGVNDPMGNFEQPEQKRNKSREAGASSILKLFQNHSSHRSPGKQESTQSIDGTNATSSSGAESHSEVYPTEPHTDTIVEGSRTNHSLSRCNHQQQKKENQGTSILRLFQNHMSHCSTGKQELVQSTEGLGSGINSTQNGSGQDEQRRENWNYKVDEIDPSVVGELPPEIQEEVRMWLHRPHKRPNVAKRGSSIAHYFLPTKNS